MLAQNFKTAEELGMEKGAYEAHLKVLKLLEQGEVTHISVFGKRAWGLEEPISNGFNMAPVWIEDSCGTVGCLLGWAHYFGASKVNAFMTSGTSEQRTAYNRLTMPTRADSRTVDEAAHALRTYLVTGKADWGF